MYRIKLVRLWHQRIQQPRIYTLWQQPLSTGLTSSIVPSINISYWIPSVLPEEQGIGNLCLGLNAQSSSFHYRSARPWPSSFDSSRFQEVYKQENTCRTPEWCSREQKRMDAKPICSGRRKDKKIAQYRFWQEGCYSEVISSLEFYKQKLNYIHQNPVRAEFVRYPQDYLYSSAIDYAGEKGLIEVIVVRG